MTSQNLWPHVKFNERKFFSPATFFASKTISLSFRNALVKKGLNKLKLILSVDIPFEGAFTHTVSIFWHMHFQFLNWNISIQNAMHCVFTLITNLGLSELALTMHEFSTCVNGMLQLGFSIIYYIMLRFWSIYNSYCSSVDIIVITSKKNTMLWIHD